jgi:hypothetical protein
MPPTRLATAWPRRAPACTRRMARWPSSAWTALPNSPMPSSSCWRRWPTPAAGSTPRHRRGPGGFAALRGYLDDLMAGHPDQPLKLFIPLPAMAVARGQMAPRRRRHCSFPTSPSARPSATRRCTAAGARCARGTPQGSAPGFRARPAEVAEGRSQGHRRDEDIGGHDRNDAQLDRRARLLVDRARRPRRAWPPTACPTQTAQAKMFAMRLGAHIKKLVEGHCRDPDSRAACAKRCTSSGLCHCRRRSNSPSCVPPIVSTA